MTSYKVDFLDPKDENFDKLMHRTRIENEIKDFVFENIICAKANDAKALRAVRIEVVEKLMAQAKSVGAVQVMLFAQNLKTNIVAFPDLSTLVAKKEGLHKKASIDVREMSLVNEQIERIESKVDQELNAIGKRINNMVKLLKVGELDDIGNIYHDVESSYKVLDFKEDNGRKLKHYVTDADLHEKKTFSTKLKKSLSANDLTKAEWRESKVSSEVYKGRENIAKEFDSEAFKHVMQFAIRNDAVEAIFALYLSKIDGTDIQKAAKKVENFDTQILDNKDVFDDFYVSLKYAADGDKKAMFRLKSKIVQKLVMIQPSKEVADHIFKALEWDLVDETNYVDTEDSIQEMKEFLKNEVYEDNYIRLKELMKIDHLANFVSAYREDFAKISGSDFRAKEIFLGAIVENLYNFKFFEKDSGDYGDEYYGIVSLRTSLLRAYEEFDMPKTHLDVYLISKALNDGRDIQVEAISGANQWSASDVVKQLIMHNLFTKDVAEKALSNRALDFSDSEKDQVFRMFKFGGKDYSKVLSGDAELLKFFLINSGEHNAWQIFKHEQGNQQIFRDGTEDVYDEYKLLIQNFATSEEFQSAFGVLRYHNDDNLPQFYKYISFLAKEFLRAEDSEFIIDEQNREKLEGLIKENAITKFRAEVADDRMHETIVKNAKYFVQFVANNSQLDSFIGSLRIPQSKYYDIIQEFAAEDNAFMVKYILEADILYGKTESQIHEELLKIAATNNAFNVFIKVCAKSKFTIEDLTERVITDLLPAELAANIAEYIENKEDDFTEVAPAENTFKEPIESVNSRRDSPVMTKAKADKIGQYSISMTTINEGEEDQFSGFGDINSAKNVGPRIFFGGNDDEFIAAYIAQQIESNKNRSSEHEEDTESQSSDASGPYDEVRFAKASLSSQSSAGELVGDFVAGGNTEGHIVKTTKFGTFGLQSPEDTTIFYDEELNDSDTGKRASSTDFDSALDESDASMGKIDLKPKAYRKKMNSNLDFDDEDENGVIVTVKTPTKVKTPKQKVKSDLTDDSAFETDFTDTEDSANFIRTDSDVSTTGHTFTGFDTPT